MTTTHTSTAATAYGDTRSWEDVNRALDKRAEELALGSPEALATDAATLAEYFEARRFAMRHKPWPLFARPLALPSAVAGEVATTAARMHRLLEWVIDRYLAGDPEVVGFFGWLQPFHHLIVQDCAYRPRAQLARFDGALAADGKFRFFENNTACPSGYAQNGIVNLLWRATESAQLLLDGFAVADTPHTTDPAAFGRHLLELGDGASGTVGLVTLPSGYPYELPAIDYVIREAGGRSVSGAAADVAPTGDGVTVDGRRVDAIYAKLAPEDLLDYDDLGGFFAAARVVPIVSGFAAGLLSESKGALAFLTAAAARGWIPPGDAEFVAAHVPWTALVTDRTVDHPDHGPGPLADLLRSHRHDFVLKPAVGTQGQRFVAGADATPAGWDEAVSTALAGDDMWVAQQAVEMPRLAMPRPAEDGDGYDAVPMNVDLHVYVLGGEVLGFGGRAAPSSPINVWAGGSWVPVAVLQPDQP